MDTFLKYVDNNRKELKKDYKTFESFKNNTKFLFLLPTRLLPKQRKKR